MNDKTNVKEEFKTRFARLRANTRLSQLKLGKLLNLSPATIGYYENGDRVPDIVIAARIADYFNVSVDYLLGLSDVKSTEQDMKVACEVTRLSEKAINNIKSTYHKFPRFAREETIRAISNDSLFCNDNDEKKACIDYFSSIESEWKEYITVRFLESESFERIMHKISEACEKKEEATRLKEEAFGLEPPFTFEKVGEKIECAKNADDCYKAAILDIYELIKEFVESYIPGNQEAPDNAQHHETQE